MSASARMQAGPACLSRSLQDQIALSPLDDASGCASLPPSRFWDSSRSGELGRVGQAYPSSAGPQGEELVRRLADKMQEMHEVLRAHQHSPEVAMGPGGNYPAAHPCSSRPSAEQRQPGTGRVESSSVALGGASSSGSCCSDQGGQEGAAGNAHSSSSTGMRSGSSRAASIPSGVPHGDSENSNDASASFPRRSLVVRSAWELGPASSSSSEPAPGSSDSDAAPGTTAAQSSPDVSPGGIPVEAEGRSVPDVSLGAGAEAEEARDWATGASEPRGTTPQGGNVAIARPMRNIPAGTATLAVRNVPARYTPESLAVVWPPAGSYNLLYVPYRLGHTIGLAFLNFLSHEAAVVFATQWHWRKLTPNSRSKPLDVTPAYVQGYRKMLEMFKDQSASLAANRNRAPLLFTETGDRKDLTEELSLVVGTREQEQAGNNPGRRGRARRA